MDLDRVGGRQIDRRRRLAIGLLQLDEEIVSVAIAAVEALARPALRPPDGDRLPRLVDRRGLLEEYARPKVRMWHFPAVQGNGGFEHAHRVIFEDHFVVFAAPR